MGAGDRAWQSDVLHRHADLPEWNGSGFISGMGTTSLNRIIFDGHGGAKPAELECGLSRWIWRNG